MSGRAWLRSVLRLSLAGTALVACMIGMAACGGDSRPEPLEPAEPVPLDQRWPATLQLGMANGFGGAATMREIAPFGFRYQYLAGGAGTGAGWQTWEAGDGAFVPAYVAESAAAGLIPVFSYYMLLQSTPEEGDEQDRIRSAIRDRDVMRAYLGDLQQVFLRAAEAGGTMVLHVEPDLWGHLQQLAPGDDASRLRVQVSGSGLAGLQELPDTAAGLAQAIVRLRDEHAPNVILGYHLSAWATGTDPFLADTDAGETQVIADRAAAFYRSLGADFDLTFTEFSDRDAGFKEVEYGDGGASWWDAADFDRHVALIAAFHQGSGLPVVLWQIPYGNTKMRALDNSWNHYQDNRVEWLLDDPGDGSLARYVAAGVVALLFGRGADGATDAGDAAGDGVTNPPPINGNDRESRSADDDGGYFAEVAAAYYATGPLPLD